MFFQDKIMKDCILATQNLTEAQLAKSKLESNNIFCELRTNDASGVLPDFRFSQGIQLYVSQKDLQKAKEILKKEKLYKIKSKK